MPRKLTAVFFVRTSPRTKQRIAAVLAEGQDESDYVRRAVEAALLRSERAAMSAAAEARTAATPEPTRGELLELDGPTPTKGPAK